MPGMPAGAGSCTLCPAPRSVITLLPRFTFALACALWDHNPLSNQLHKPCRSTSLSKVLDGLCSPFWFHQIAAPCRRNELIEELHTARQERDTSEQELDRTSQELQASIERNIELSKQLGLAQDSHRATERSRDDYMAELQQVGLSVQRKAVLGGASRGSAQVCFALKVQWGSERWRSCASQGLPHRLTAAGL